MRRLPAGIFCSLLLLAALPVLARNEVESIGFGSLYRPNTYVPMLINVSVEKSGTYQIRVVQEDLDRDHEIFKQDITLTGADEGKGSDQRFWMYFIPQPSDGGLPDTTRGGTLRDLQQQLKVFLCDEKGKQIMQLPVTQTILNVENAQAGPFTAPRGTKLVLAVTDGAAQPIWRDYQQSIGTLEDVVFVTVRSFDLPEDIRGYEMVDAIVWLAAPVPDPAKPSDEKRHRAIDSWVRAGGHLVICQPAQRDATAPMADILPVVVKEVAPRTDLEPLKTIATEKLAAVTQQQPTLEEQIEDPFNPGRKRRRDDWALLPKAQYMFARATPKPGAVTVLPLNWNADGTDSSPYLARIGHGLGCVTWVAHDLSDPSITNKAKSGWPYVWDKVLDFKSDLIIVDSQTTDAQKHPYSPGAAADIGHSLLAGMELSSKSRALVSIAVVFFIGYWIVAGPGVYLYLVTKSRPQFSWFMFAFSAVVATAITVLVVKLVVRGAPELHHVTVIRGAPNEPNIAISRFGLYIPRDGAQEISLPEVAPKNVSYVNAYPQHPAQPRGDVEFPAQIPYLIPIHDATDDSGVAITVPYRSTLKQFMTRRVGVGGGAIGGSAKLRETEAGWRIEGLFTNGTEQKLRNVYIAYYDPSPYVENDYVLYLPTWEKSQTIDLSDFNSNAVKFITIAREATNMTGMPEQKIRLKGEIGKPGSDKPGLWSRYWYASLRNNGFGNSNVDDLNDEIKKTFPMMSLFGRLPPMRNDQNKAADRVEVLRRGARNMDMSWAVAAGRIVVLAEADGQPPLPFPLMVEGQKVEGKGTLFYQFALPLERIAAAPTTQPATQPSPPQPTAIDTLPPIPSPGTPGEGKGGGHLRLAQAPAPTLPRSTGSGGRN